MKHKTISALALELGDHPLSYNNKISIPCSICIASCWRESEFHYETSAQKLLYVAIISMTAGLSSLSLSLPLESHIIQFRQTNHDARPLLIPPPLLTLTTTRFHLFTIMLMIAKLRLPFCFIGPGKLWQGPSRHGCRGRSCWVKKV